MAKATALDLERTFVHGNTKEYEYEEDKMLSSLDGWLSKSVLIDDITMSEMGIEENDIIGKILAMTNLLPRPYRKLIPQFKVYTDFESINLLQDQIVNRETALGDAFLTGTGEIVVRRIKVEHLPVLDMEPTNKRVLWLTLPSNTVYGIFKDIRVRSKFELLDGQIDIKSDVQGDAHFEEHQASIVVKSTPNLGD